MRSVVVAVSDGVSGGVVVVSGGGSGAVVADGSQVDAAEGAAVADLEPLQ